MQRRLAWLAGRQRKDNMMKVALTTRCPSDMLDFQFGEQLLKYLEASAYWHERKIAEKISKMRKENSALLKF